MQQWLRCFLDGIDVQSNLTLKHVGVEGYSSFDLKTFPDHPSKGDASEAVTRAIRHGTTSDI